VAKLGEVLQCKICGDDYKRKTANQRTCSKKSCKRELMRRLKRRKQGKPEVETERVCQNPACKKLFLYDGSGRKYCTKNCYYEHKKIQQKKSHYSIVCDTCYDEFVTPFPQQKTCNTCRGHTRKPRYHRGSTDADGINDAHQTFPSMSKKFLKKIYTETLVFSEEEVLEFIRLGKKETLHKDMPRQANS